jgi:hypothetical protein
VKLPAAQQSPGSRTFLSQPQQDKHRNGLMPKGGQTQVEPRNGKSHLPELPASPFLHSQRNSHKPASQSPLYKPIPYRSQPPKQQTKPQSELPVQEPLIEDTPAPREDKETPKPAVEARESSPQSGPKQSAQPPTTNNNTRPAIPFSPRPQEPIRPAATPNRISSTHNSSKGQSLYQLIEQHPDLPLQSAILGQCEDGLPMLLDMSDPTPGAVIAIGDEREEQLELLRTAVSSLAMRSSPRRVINSW